MKTKYTEKEQEQYNLLRGKAKQIYAKLRGMATTCSKVFESVDSLAKDFNLTPRGVYKIIDRLESFGLLEVRKELIGTGKVKRYRNNYYFPLSTTDPVDDLSEYENNNKKDKIMTVRKKFSELEQGEKVLLFQKLKEGLSSNNPQLKANLANALDRYIAEFQTPEELNTKDEMVKGMFEAKDKELQELRKLTQDLGKNYLYFCDHYKEIPTKIPENRMVEIKKSVINDLKENKIEL